MWIRLRMWECFLKFEYAGGEVSWSQIETLTHEMEALIKDMPVEPVPAGTFERVLQQKNFSLYKKGKYLL